MQKEPSPSELKAAGEVVKSMGEMLLSESKKQALAEVFTKEQIAAINRYSKKHALNRDLLISEIITAGLDVKGIVSTNRKCG